MSKMPQEAVCSAISSRVRRSFGQKFASRGREEKVKHDVGYFHHGLARLISHQNFAAVVTGGNV